jgi:hypothetical protein
MLNISFIYFLNIISYFRKQKIWEYLFLVSSAPEDDSRSYSNNDTCRVTVKRHEYCMIWKSWITYIHVFRAVLWCTLLFPRKNACSIRLYSDLFCWEFMLCCLIFSDLRILITPLVSSSSKWTTETTLRYLNW